MEAALLDTEGTLPHYQIILTREHGLDQMEVQVEVTPQMFNDRSARCRDYKAEFSRPRSCAGYPGQGLRWSRPSPSAQRRQSKNAVIDRRTVSRSSSYRSSSRTSRDTPPLLHRPAARRRASIFAALSLADTEQFGIVRMIVSDWERAAAISQRMDLWRSRPRFSPSKCPTVPAAWLTFLARWTEAASISSTCMPFPILAEPSRPGLLARGSGP